MTSDGTTADGTIDVVHLHPQDNVCVAARNLRAGQSIRVGGIDLELQGEIRIGHKIALRAIGLGEPILKYGQRIGVSTESVAPGGWVHTHNLAAGALTIDYAKAEHVPPDPAPVTGRTFQGYRRACGRAGTRNYVAVISTVNCSASVSKYVARRFDESVLKDYPNIDGVIALTHPGGCGMAYGGLQHGINNRVLGGMARHPNIGAYLLIGLGCEQGAMGYLLEDQKLVQINGYGSPRQGPPVFSIQDSGGTQATVEAAAAKLAELLPIANDVKRVAIPASELILGTECGGSDGNSGVTANPAVGVASDLIVAAGGTSILAETSEIYGAEQLLTRRARTPEVADKLLERIRWWEWYAKTLGAELDNNPSVGNKEGGLTTIYEKSLGAVAKGGSTALCEVYQYAEQVTAKGLVVMDTPGFDPPSVTGMVAGGANVVVFTTGRGSCYGCKPTPTIKIASNTPMFERMRDDMDIDAGTILAGQSVGEVGEEIFESILAVASGRPTKSERHGIGEDEFFPWHIGPML
jgi:altronate hydrolase